MSEVEIKNAPDNLQVFTDDGMNVPTAFGIRKINLDTERYLFLSQKTNAVIDSSKRVIRVNLHQDHVLVFKKGEEELRYHLYRKLNVWWAIADFIGGGIPALVDAMTGSRSSDSRWIPLDIAAGAFPTMIDMTTGSWYYVDNIDFAVLKSQTQLDRQTNIK